MSVKLLTENHLVFVNLIGGCTCLSESTLVKMWKSRVEAHIFIDVLQTDSYLMLYTVHYAWGPFEWIMLSVNNKWTIFGK